MDFSIPDTVTFILSDEQPFFSELNELLIAMQSLYIAVEVIRVQRIEYRQGDYASIECRLLEKEIRIPLYGPLQAAMDRVKPDFIQLTVVPHLTKSSYSHSFSNLNGAIECITNKMLVNYIEGHRSEIEAIHGKRPQWPDCWQMGWAIRNALSHNGRVFDNPGRHPVSWSGYNIAPTDEPGKCILDDVNNADVLLLLIEMEQTRIGQALPTL